MESCFYISPIGKRGSVERQRSDEVFRRVVRPAVDRIGMKPLRGDHIQRPGSILSQVLDEIWRAPICIADLHEYNPNVLYEVAFAHATRTPVIVLMDEADDVDRLPFDIDDQRVIWLSLDDERSIVAAGDAVYRQLQEPPGSTPISSAFDLRRLEEDLPRAMARMHMMMNDVLFLLRYQQAGKLGRLRKRLRRRYVKTVPARARQVMIEEWEAAFEGFLGRARANPPKAVFETGRQFTGRCVWRALDATSQLLGQSAEAARPRAQVRSHLRIAS